MTNQALGRFTLVAFAIATLGLTTASQVQAEVWTEDFDDGYGRFTTTSGQADSLFAYDASGERIVAEFYRRDINSFPVEDRRLAMLDRAYSEADAVGYRVEWTPISASGGGAWPLVGFFDSQTMRDVAVTRIDVNPGPEGSYELSINWDQPDVFNIDPTGTTWFFGETYALEFWLDGPSNSISLTTSVLDGNEFVEQGSGTWPFSSNLEYQFDSLGIGNLHDVQFGSSAVAAFDNFSFLPEPSSALLFGVAGAYAVKRRMRFA